MATEAEAMQPASRPASGLEQFDWQRLVFAPRLNRYELMKAEGLVPQRTVRVEVLRNHAVELVQSALPPLLAFAGLRAEWRTGDYDDTLTALGAEPCDLLFVWLDFERYEALADAALADWLAGRLTALRRARPGPMVVANWPEESPRAAAVNHALAAWAEEDPFCEVLDLRPVRRDLGETFFARPRAALTGTSFSDAACLEAARALAFRHMAGAFAPPLKAVALDLDNTLYAGVLGEDGIEGLVLEPGHVQLQERLAELSGRGVFIAVTSRNEPQDVEALFRERADFPLKPEHVSSWQVSWSAKSASLERAAKDLNIAPDAFLVVDDNPGELVEMMSRWPGLRAVYAGRAPDETAAAVAAYPGLWRERIDPADLVRVADMRVNAERRAMADTAEDGAGYIAALETRLTFRLDPASERARLADMSRKTNQFNLAVRRLEPAEIDIYLSAADRAVVAVALSDRLSDSGVIGALYFRRDGERLRLEEACVSCRAMGRSLEDAIVLEAVRGALETLPAEEIVFDVVKAPRNDPARAWLQDFTGVTLGEGPQEVAVRWADTDAMSRISRLPLRIGWEIEAHDRQA